MSERGKKNRANAKKIKDAQDNAVMAKLQQCKVTSDSEFVQDLPHALWDAGTLRGRTNPFMFLYWQEHGTVQDLPDFDPTQYQP